MASIFLSHSSKDKPVAQRLATDLRQRGHDVWLDVWQIHVGECIPTRIEEGIRMADFLVLLLSKDAVRSRWVEREWKAAYWTEVSSNRVAILPVRVDSCTVPTLLQTKKYADISESYDVGFDELLQAIDCYTTLKKDVDFFRAIPTVWAEDRSLAHTERLARNEHWDRFETVVTVLDDARRLKVQAANSLYYLTKYDLRTSELKAVLQNLGFFNGAVDDAFCDELTDAVTSFQTAYNLRHRDGIFGPLTYLALAEVVQSESRTGSVVEQSGIGA